MATKDEASIPHRTGESKVKGDDVAVDKEAEVGEYFQKGRKPWGRGINP